MTDNDLWNYIVDQPEPIPSLIYEDVPNSMRTCPECRKIMDNAFWTHLEFARARMFRHLKALHINEKEDILS